MPSPLGHALGGIAAGWLVSAAPRVTATGRGETGRGFRARVRELVARDPWRWRVTAVWAALGLAPDLDLLFGTHNTYSHSVGAVAIVFALAWLLTRGRTGLALAAAAAYGSHLPLDWLGHDASAPYGIMALWPVSREFFYADAQVFMAISRRYWQDGFWTHNLLAVLRELALLLPVVAAVWTLRQPGPGRAPRPALPPAPGRCEPS
jgi:hypothetical protein